MSSLSRDEVAHVAGLARIQLSDDELETFAGQLDSIVGFVASRPSHVNLDQIVVKPRDQHSATRAHRS